MIHKTQVFMSGIMGIVGACLPSEVRAQTEMPGAGSPDLFLATLKMIGALALVIGILLLALYLLRRTSMGRSAAFGGREPIRIIATKALAPKKFITLVEIGNSILTLGVTAEHITCLDKTPSADFKNQFETPSPSGKPTDAEIKEGDTDFSQRLQSVSEPQKRPEEQEE